jgi:malonyl-CoA O-methyltransferase
MNLKFKISNSFSRSASSYNANALLQKDIALNVVELVNKYSNSNSKIIDLGSGTGFIAQNISNDIIQLDFSEKMAEISKKFGFAICADMEQMPIKHNIFDLCCSSSAMQWTNLEKVFDECFRIIKNNGYLIFSIFGDKTLAELKSCYEKNGMKSKVHEFKNIKEISNLLENSNFKIVETKVQNNVLNFQKVLDLLKFIKIIGAGNSLLENNTKLSRKLLNIIENEYKTSFNANSLIYSNWQVYYFVCKKSL